MKQLANLLRYTRLYGLRLAFFYLIYPRIRCSEQAFLRRHYEIKRFLKRKYSHIIDKYRDQSVAADVIPADAPIWISWLQGYDAMPLNNPEFYALNSVINNVYDENTWCGIKKETPFHKLSHKSSYYLQTDNNIETFWGKLKNSGL